MGFLHMDKNIPQ